MVPAAVAVLAENEAVTLKIRSNARATNAANHGTRAAIAVCPLAADGGLVGLDGSTFGALIDFLPPDVLDSGKPQ